MILTDDSGKKTVYSVGDAENSMYVVSSDNVVSQGTDTSAEANSADANGQTADNHTDAPQPVATPEPQAEAPTAVPVAEPTPTEAPAQRQSQHQPKHLLYQLIQI